MLLIIGILLLVYALWGSNPMNTSNAGRMGEIVNNLKSGYHGDDPRVGEFNNNLEIANKKNIKNDDKSIDLSRLVRISSPIAGVIGVLCIMKHIFL